jgi:hypothetical protein
VQLNHLPGVVMPAEESNKTKVCHCCNQAIQNGQVMLYHGVIT